MSRQTKQLQQRLNGLWDTTHLCRLFKKSNMTVCNWRRYNNLPFVTLPGERPTVRYVPDDVMRWADQNQVPVGPKAIAMIYRKKRSPHAKLIPVRLRRPRTIEQSATV